MQRFHDRRSILLILITVLVIVVILHLISIVETEVKRVPTFDEADESEVVSQQVCRQVNYSYNTVWLGWRNAPEGFVNPVLELQNTDVRAGSFSIQFGFFIEEETPYDLFSGRLLFEDARFVSERVTVWLEPKEAMNISMPTRVTAGDNHWAIGYIDPPSHAQCEEETSKTSVSKTARFGFVDRESVTRKTLFEILFGFRLF